MDEPGFDIVEIQPGERELFPEENIQINNIINNVIPQNIRFNVNDASYQFESYYQNWVIYLRSTPNTTEEQINNFINRYDSIYNDLSYLFQSVVWNVISNLHLINEFSHESEELISVMANILNSNGYHVFTFQQANLFVCQVTLNH